MYDKENQMHLQNPFNSTGLTKGKSTADSFHGNRFITRTPSSQEISRQQQFEAAARSLRRSFQVNQDSKQSRASSKRNSQTYIKKQKSNLEETNIAAKLAITLKDQEVNLLCLKQWTENQKHKINKQLHNLTLQFTNFIEKHKSSLLSSIDKLYLDMLQTYQELKKTARELYTQRNFTRPKQNPRVIGDKQNEDSLANYGLIQQLRSQQYLLRQYHQAQHFYSKNYTKFAKLSAKIDKVKTITQTNLLEDMNIEYELKQFQNYLYSSMKQVQNRILWDKALTKQYDV